MPTAINLGIGNWERRVNLASWQRSDEGTILPTMVCRRVVERSRCPCTGAAVPVVCQPVAQACACVPGCLCNVLHWIGLVRCAGRDHPSCQSRAPIANQGCQAVSTLAINVQHVRMSIRSLTIG